MQFTDEQQKYIDEHYQLLPVDADGVPIRLGDVMEGVDKYDTLCNVKGEVIEVSYIATDNEGLVASVALKVRGADGKSWHRSYLDPYAAVYRHVEPRTVEDVLRDLQQDTLTAQGEYASEVIEDDDYTSELDKLVEHAVAELHELMANDGLAPENGVSAHGGHSNDGEAVL